MWGWLGAAAALVAIVIAAINLDFIHKTDTLITTAGTKLAAIHASMNHDTATSTLTLASPAFDAGASIPAVYTCDGSQKSPPLAIGGVPAGVQSLVLIMDDPDVPKQVKPDGMFDHWVLFNIPATTTAIAEGETPGVMGANGAGSASYTGPCPPKAYEPSEHRYFFKLYALDTMLDLPAGATRDAVEQAMQGHVIAEAQLMGRYKRP